MMVLFCIFKKAAASFKRDVDFIKLAFNLATVRGRESGGRRGRVHRAKQSRAVALFSFALPPFNTFPVRKMRLMINQSVYTHKSQQGCATTKTKSVESSPQLMVTGRWEDWGVGKLSQDGSSWNTIEIWALHSPFPNLSISGWYSLLWK